ncbi:PREDICTED: uncharacterized protein LOC104817334 [Tarenaya hassleriana]|uniref:uncharacterized protein LOC104817334 n=1 Tax=Tarenaya hassleriana TaxID=28532 RepID=UPI00053C2D76|nr:PREDICTED: uncharacterized protein LOC104817334 [Tarenaya hassleriana]
MGDNGMNPALQKPPGFRDPNMGGGPPPGIRQPARKQALPTTFRPKKKRRNCCMPCCCCFCVTLLLLIFVLVVACGVFYLWFDPKLPTFSLASCRLDQFKVSADPDGASLSANAVARVEIKNPNLKIAFYLGDTDVDVTVGQGNDETGLGSATVPGFRQDPRNTTRVKVATAVTNQLVETRVAKRLAMKFQSKDLVINVEAKSKVGLGIGNIKIGMLAVNLKCGGISLNKLDSESPKCALNTLRWINLH